MGFLENVSGRAGKLFGEKDHYTAYFEFKAKDEGEVRALKGYLEQRQSQYESEILLEQSQKFWELWHLSLISHKGRPKEQEAFLIQALHSLLRDLRQYKKQR